MSLEKLEAYRHDIAECYESLSDIVEDASEAFRGYRLECKLLSTPNLVRKTRTIIDHCLENEERAAKFLRIVQTNNKELHPLSAAPLTGLIYPECYNTHTHTHNG